MNIWLKSENRSAIHNISERVIKEIAPDELEVYSIVIEPLIDMVANEKSIVLDSSDKMGGLGGADLIIVVIVPVITTLIENMLSKMTEKSISELKKKYRKNKQFEEHIKPTEIEAIIQQKGIKISKRRIKKMANSINKVLSEYFISLP